MADLKSMARLERAIYRDYSCLDGQRDLSDKDYYKAIRVESAYTDNRLRFLARFRQLHALRNRQNLLEVKEQYARMDPKELARIEGAYSEIYPLDGPSTWSEFAFVFGSATRSQVSNDLSAYASVKGLDLSVLFHCFALFRLPLYEKLSMQPIRFTVSRELKASERAELAAFLIQQLNGDSEQIYGDHDIKITPIPIEEADVYYYDVEFSTPMCNPPVC